MLRKGTETPKEGDTGKTADWATDWAKEGDTGKTADWATDWVLEKNYLDGSSTLTSSKTDTKLPVPGLEKPKPAKRSLTYYVVHGSHEVFDSTNGGLKAALARIGEPRTDGERSVLIIGKELPTTIKTIVKVIR